MNPLPSGDVTFLFTDIEGSTRLIQDYPLAMKDALKRHNALLEAAIDAHRGHIFKVIGDAVCSAFEKPGDALNAALDAQRALHQERWGEIGALRVRIGLHAGAAEAADGEYVSSLTLVRVQRVMSAGHGGQVLLSSAAAERVRSELPKGTALRELGAYKLRGLTEAESLHQLVAADLPSEFPPLTAESFADSAAPLQQLARGNLIGRTEELGQLKQRWEQAQQARGHLVLVAGEPGVGKTRLAQALIAHAQQSGATLLRGGCYEYEATTPYLPFVEAFREWTRRQSPEQLREALGPTAAEIAKLAPEIELKLGPLPPNALLSPSEERLRMFDNAARFLQSLAAEPGLLVFIDDVHWADQGTLSLLHYLLRHLRNDRVLFLAAYREMEVDRTHPLASALVDWNRERLATRVAVGRLSLADTGELLAALFGQKSVSGALTSALYRETEGNPFFVEEVVKSLIEQGGIYREGEHWARKETHALAIPQSVKEAIGRRLNRLSEPTIDALRTAAALGKIFSFQELAGVFSAGEDALLDTLDEASAAQLIRANASSAGGDLFAFTHDKIREVLYEQLNPIRQRRLHQRIGDTLETLRGTLAAEAADEETGAERRDQDLAYHFTRAGELAKSLIYSRRAARNAERVFAHDEALTFLEQARGSAEALKRMDDVGAIDEQIGDIHAARGMFGQAVESYERALGVATMHEARAALKAKVGKAYSPVGDPRGLVALEEALVELDPRTQTNALALATALVGRYYHYRTDHAKAIEFLERARQLAEPLDDAGTLCEIYRYLAGAHQNLLQFRESEHWARTNIAMGKRKKFPLGIAVGNNFLGETAAGRGRWDDALAFAANALESGRKVGSIARVAWSAFSRTLALHGRGELADAQREAEAALGLCAQIGEERLATWLDPIAAVTAADLGDDEGARMHAERAWERAHHLNQAVLSAWSLHALGYVAMQRDEIGAALNWYGQYVVLIRNSTNQLARNLVLSRAAEAFFRAGHSHDAAKLVDQALAVAALGDAPHYGALARRVQGQIFAAQGKYDDARRVFAEALATFTQCSSRLELARTFYHRAALRARCGEGEAARIDAIRARDAFAEMGAVRDRVLAEQLVHQMVLR